MKTRTLFPAAVLTAFCCASFAQTLAPPSTPPATSFLAADVHASPYSFFSTYFRVAPLVGDRFVARHASLLDLITMAYKVEPDAVAGGPPGLEFDHYDIIAKTPPGTTSQNTPALLQALLAERFKLVVKTETRTLPAFLLKPGKEAAKMKPAADPAGDSGCRFVPPSPPPAANAPPSTFTFSCHNLTAERLAETLRGMGWSYITRPVVDQTGLKGAYDFDLRFSYQAGTPGGISLFEAVEKQLGLKLEPGTAPRPALSIVSAAERPTPNAPDVEKGLPAPPQPSFEVAVIKPAEPGSRGGGLGFRSNGEVMQGGETLQQMISENWDISGASIVGAPDFYTKQRWTVDAKVPHPDEDATASGRPAQVDFDSVKLMMRSLLEERFGLKAHTEERPGDGYTLLAAGPKLKKADPANRTSCDSRPAPGEKDPRIANPLLTRYMRCQNVTMEQFAGQLMLYAKDYLKSPVKDSTGVEGRYDVTLAFSDSRTARFPPGSPGATPGGGGVAPGGDAGPGDPVGTPVSLQEALSKQLGLKLELQKRPIPVLVVDHLDEKPTEN